MKRIISVILTLAMTVGITVNSFAAAAEQGILSFSINGVAGKISSGGATNTITVAMPEGTDLSAIEPEYECTLSDGAKMLTPLAYVKDLTVVNMIEVELSDGTSLLYYLTVTAGSKTANTNNGTTASNTAASTDVKNGIVNGYYYKNGKKVCSAWVKVSGKTYRTDKSGKIIKNAAKKISGKLYLFNASGVKQTGTKWVTINGKKYRLKKSSVVKSKLLKVGKYKYYFNQSGIMQKSKVIKYKGKRYYVNAKGRVQKNKWVVYKNKYYRADKNGKLICGKTVKIGGKKYTFSKTGVCKNKKYKKKTTTKSTQQAFKPRVLTDAECEIIKQEIIRLMKENYRPDLNYDDEKLNKAAAIRAKEIIKQFSHTRPNGLNADTVLDEVGYGETYEGAALIDGKLQMYLSGENIAMSGATVQESDYTINGLKNTAYSLLQSWRYSEGHYKQMMDMEHKDCGIGISSYIEDGMLYVTAVQIFAITAADWAQINS